MNVQIFDTKSIGTGTTTTTDKLKVINTDGYFSLQWSFTSSGTGTFKVLSSNDGVNFIDCNSAIGGATVTGTANIAEVVMIPCKWVKISCTANAGNMTALNAWFYGVERVSA